MDIIAGSQVEYRDIATLDTKTGKVVAIMDIVDCINKNIIGERYCCVEYDSRCYTDEVKICDVKLIE